MTRRFVFIKENFEFVNSEYTGFQNFRKHVSQAFLYSGTLPSILCRSLDSERILRRSILLFARLSEPGRHSESVCHVQFPHTACCSHNSIFILCTPSMPHRVHFVNSNAGSSKPILFPILLTTSSHLAISMLYTLLLTRWFGLEAK